MFADRLAEAELPIDDGEVVVLEGDLDGLAGEHLAGFEPLHVGRNAQDAVRIVADEVGFDEVRRDAFGFGGVATGGAEDGRGEGAQAVVLDVHVLNSKTKQLLGLLPQRWIVIIGFQPI